MWLPLRELLGPPKAKLVSRHEAQNEFSERQLLGQYALGQSLRGAAIAVAI